MPDNSIEGFDAFADELREFADDLDRAAERIDDEAVDRGTKRTAEDVHELAADLAPVDTGELQESGHVEQVGDGEYLVVFTADHAAAQEYGTGGFEITPDDAEALRFEIDGETIYAAKVDHPGVQSQPYLRPALDANRRALPENVLAEMNQILDEELS